MEAFTEQYNLHSHDHEPVDVRRDILGVSFLPSTWSSPAYHPPLVGSPMKFRRTNSMRPETSSTNMDPLSGFVSTLSEIRGSSICSKVTVQLQSTAYPPNLQVVQATLTIGLNPARAPTCLMTHPLISAAKNPVLHCQRTTSMRDSTSNALTQEGQILNPLGGVRRVCTLALKSTHPTPCPTPPTQGSEHALLPSLFSNVTLVLCRIFS